MITTTFKFYVEGDSYEEILDKGAVVIGDLLGLTTEDALDSVTLEINIIENEVFEESDMTYAAEMIGRLKNAR